MQTIEYKNPKLNKSTWPKGAWDNEPDKKQWVDASTGLPCLIVRNRHGGLCGYVGVSKSHPYYEKGYNDCNVEAHGGLTFANHCQETEDECDGVCHKVDAGEDDSVWWLGFDCVHAGDYAPGERHHWSGDTYKDITYVTSDVESLARQLKDISQ